MINDDFIMSPKVDFAFKEIMFSDKVRKGFLSAVLEIPVRVMEIHRICEVTATPV